MEHVEPARKRIEKPEPLGGRGAGLGACWGVIAGAASMLGLSIPFGEDPGVFFVIAAAVVAMPIGCMLGAIAGALRLEHYGPRFGAFGAALPILFILAADNVPDHDVEWWLTALGATAYFVALGVLVGFGFRKSMTMPSMSQYLLQESENENPSTSASCASQEPGAGGTVTTKDDLLEFVETHAPANWQ